MLPDFSQHEITHQIEAGSFGTWLLRKPNSYGENLRIVAAEGQLVVFGDWEPVVFGIYLDSRVPADLVKWIGQHEASDTYYPVQKAKRGMGPDQVRTWDLDAAFRALDEMRKDPEYAGQIPAIEAGIWSLEEMPSYDLMISAMMEIDSESFRWAGGVGYSVRPNVLVAFAAVRRLWELLSAS